MYERKIPPEFKAPFEHVFEAYGSKWTMRIVGLLHHDFPLRYSEIRKRLPGLTDPVLSSCLKRLEAEDIIERKQYNEIPIRVEYALTKKGWELVSLCQIICLWASRYYESDQAEINSYCFCDRCILNEATADDDYLLRRLKQIAPERLSNITFHSESR